jgi:K+-sensing histidine kinase KdpD
MVRARWNLLRKRNVLGKVKDKIKTNILYLMNSFSENRTFYELIRKKYGRVKQAIDENVVWCTRVACRITNASDTHSEYVIYNNIYILLYICIIIYNIFHSTNGDVNALQCHVCTYIAFFLFYKRRLFSAR